MKCESRVTGKVLTAIHEEVRILDGFAEVMFEKMAGKRTLWNSIFQQSERFQMREDHIYTGGAWRRKSSES